MLVTASTAFCQKSDTTEARPEDVAGQPGEKGLPTSLLQPHEIPPEMEISKELLTEGEELDFKKKGGERAFDNALKATNPNEEEKKALEAAAKWWAYRLTMKKYREEERKEEKPGPAAKNAPPKERLPDLRKKLLGDIRKPAVLSPAAREWFLKALTDRLAELLDNHLLVRLNAVWLLGQLQSDNGIPNKNPPVEPTPYVGAYTLLLTVIKDDKQHLAVKIAAVRGLSRICRGALPDANDKRRGEIAMVLAAELAKKETHWWYQMALAEALGAAGVTYDPNNKMNPVVLQVLAEALADKKRHWQVRTEAARAIGRLPLDANLNIAPVAYEIVHLGLQMSQGYNANAKRDAWNNYFLILYFAFKPEKADAKVAGGKRKPGLLEALPNSKEVKDAYEQIVLMASHVLNENGKPFPLAQMKAFEEWMKGHLPTNGRITAGAPPIITQPEPAPASAKPGPAGNGKPASAITKPELNKPAPAAKPATAG